MGDMNLDELERSLIQAARQGLGPSAADRERHQAELLERLDGPSEGAGERSMLGGPAANAPPQPLGPSGSSWRAPTSSHWVRAKLLGAGLVVGVVIGGLVGFGLGRGTAAHRAFDSASGTEAVAVGQEHRAGGRGTFTLPGSEGVRARLAARLETSNESMDVKRASDARAGVGGSEGGRGETSADEVSSESVSSGEAMGGATASSPHAASQGRKGGAIAAAKPESSLAIELAMLQRARRALNADNGRLALGLVQELDERFPRGVLLEERSATRILSLCMLGRTEEARGFGRRFQERYPGSVYAERVRGSCIADVGE
jgi:hypothetical protein